MLAITSLRSFALALVGLWFFLLPSSASALSFTPTATDLTLMPGETLTKNFTLTNDSTVTKNYLTALNLVHFDATTNEPIFDAWPASLNSSVIIDTNDFTLDANAQKNITVTISLPANTTASSLVLGLIITEVAPATVVQVTPGVSSLIFVTIGQPSVLPVLTGFSASSFIRSSLPIDFTGNIINNGDRTLQPLGTVTVYNAFSKRLATFDINPTVRRIPTNQNRDFTVTWGSARTTGNFFQELWREVTNFKVGFFTAELLVAPFPGADATISQTTHVIVLPWRVLLVVLGFGAIIIVSVRRHKR